MSALEQVGVRPDYQHSSKLVCPEASLTLRDAVLKWYDIAPEEAPVPLAVRALARRNLRDGSKSGELALSGDLGFVILHRYESEEPARPQWRPKSGDGEHVDPA